MLRHTLAAIATATACAFSAPAADLPGTVWATEGGESHVTFELVDGQLFGRFSWLSNEEEQGIVAYDDNNPDPARQSCGLIGLPFVHSFSADGDEWVDGRIYNPRSGKTFRSSIKVNDGDGTLNLRGCWGFVCKTQVWTRVGDAPAVMMAEATTAEPAIGAAPDELLEANDIDMCRQPPSDG